MTNASLSQLYRSSTQPQTLSARALIDAETAVRAAQGRVVPHERDEVAAALAGSSAQADLVQFLRALEPASAELAQSLARSAAHDSRERGRRDVRQRLPQRRWQWGAVAASLVAVIALFAVRTVDQPTGALQAQLPPSAKSDQIFDGRLESAVAHQAVSDRIFRATDDEFAQDRIFSAHSGG